MRITAAVLASLALASVNAQARAIRVGANGEAEVVTEAEEPSRKDFRLALIANDGRKQAEKAAEQFTKWLSGKTRRKITSEVFESAEEAAAALQDKRADLAWLPPILGYKAQLAGSRPVAKLLRDGRDYELSVIFTHKKASQKKLKELNHVKAAWVDRASATGYVFAAARIDEENVPSKVFDVQAFLHSHEAVCKAVWSGKAEVGATFAEEPGSFRKVRPDGCLRTIGKSKTEDLRVIETSAHIPLEVFFIRRGLAESDRSALGEAVLQLRNDAEGRRVLDKVLHADAVAPATKADFVPVQKAVEAVAAWDK